MWEALWQHFGIATRGPAKAAGAAGRPPPAGTMVIAGVFVTWTHLGALRGCLGAVAPSETLAAAVPRLALAAATRDRRFEPVVAGERQGLAAEITVLGPLTALPSGEAAILAGLDPRVHGVQVKRGDLAGLLLPQVARRHGWSAVELLRQVSLKAGLPAQAWLEGDAIISAFRSGSFAASRPDFASV